MRFQPRSCPRPDCPSRSSGHHRWCFKGGFVRACDGRTVQRFLYRECRRTFSTQTFRVDYRLKKPQLNHALFGPFISKVTHRQAARVVGCSRGTVAHRLKLLGEHCREFHRSRLARAAAGGGISGKFQLDELETFEHSRRLATALAARGVEIDTLFYPADHEPPLQHEYQFDLDLDDAETAFSRLVAFFGRHAGY